MQAVLMFSHEFEAEARIKEDVIIVTLIATCTSVVSLLAVEDMYTLVLDRIAEVHSVGTSVPSDSIADTGVLVMTRLDAVVVFSCCAAQKGKAFMTIARLAQVHTF